jgi:hypothetical protein
MILEKFACGHNRIQDIEPAGSTETIIREQGCPDCLANGQQYWQGTNLQRQMRLAQIEERNEQNKMKRSEIPDYFMSPERFIKENIVLHAEDGYDIFNLFVFLRRISEQGIDPADVNLEDLACGEKCACCYNCDWSIRQPDGQHLCCEHIDHASEHK